MAQQDPQERLDGLMVQAYDMELEASALMERVAATVATVRQARAALAAGKPEVADALLASVITNLAGPDAVT